MTRIFYACAVAIGFAVILDVSLVRTTAVQQADDAVRIDADDIGGVVKSAKGPEAGVWVISETSELPAEVAENVVTDDRGRFVLPDLPKATYNVWLRGFRLGDS